MLLAVRIAADWKPGTVFPSRRLVDPEGFAGIDGAFRFGRSGIAERNLEIQEIAAGATNVIDAAPKGFAK